MFLGYAVHVLTLLNTMNWNAYPMINKSLHLFSYLCVLFVLLSCGIGANKIKKWVPLRATIKLCRNLHKKRQRRLLHRHIDFVTSTLSMTFQGTWALILVLILALIRISTSISAANGNFRQRCDVQSFQLGKHLAISYWAHCNVSG